MHSHPLLWDSRADSFLHDCFDADLHKKTLRFVGSVRRFLLPFASGFGLIVDSPVRPGSCFFERLRLPSSLASNRKVYPNIVMSRRRGWSPASPSDHLSDQRDLTLGGDASQAHHLARLIRGKHGGPHVHQTVVHTSIRSFSGPEQTSRPSSGCLSSSRHSRAPTGSRYL